MNVLVTGANGFIGQNLRLKLRETPGFQVLSFTRDNSESELQEQVSQADFIIHLAGVNRPDNPSEFESVNAGLTRTILEFARFTGHPVPVIFTSSTQAEMENPYGASKLTAEQELKRYSSETGSPVYIYRLANVFGKWCRPEYNSVVATFCHHIANELPIEIHDPSTNLKLVYIDDVIDSFLITLKEGGNGVHFRSIDPVYRVTLGELAIQIHRFKESRDTLLTESVGNGLTRALYATYLSYLEPSEYIYSLDEHVDDRGKFVECLKTKSSGQFSFFTAKPGVTRGGHYHHTKSEKFLVVQGEALFKFRHIQTGRHHEITVSGVNSQVVETIPGWAHDITNIGNEELIVLLWANEIFDPDLPDTIGASLDD